MRTNVFYFVTCFDSRYLIKGLTLYRSLLRHASSFRLWVLCFDDLAYEILQKLAIPEVVPISLTDFEEGDKELVQAKGNRSRIEYYFTCTPSLPLYVLRNFPEVNVITYLDADLFFFSDPSPIYRELGDSSILIVGHRFPPHLRHEERHGIYNVGLLSFRKNNGGLQTLNWWRERCIEWCYDRAEDGRFADQKYLDDWPARFPGVVVLQHKGAGLAPWNIAGYHLGLHNGQVAVDSQPLVFFHFHHFKQMRHWLYDPNLGKYGVHADSLLKRHIYGPYIRELRETAGWVSQLVNQSYRHKDSIRFDRPEAAVSCNIIRRVATEIRYSLFLIEMVLRRYLLVVICGRVV